SAVLSGIASPPASQTGSRSYTQNRVIRIASSPTAVVIHRAVPPCVCGSGTRAPAAGAPAATPTTPAPARPGSAVPIQALAAASAPGGWLAGSAGAPFFPPRLAPGKAGADAVADGRDLVRPRVDLRRRWPS